MAREYSNKSEDKFYEKNNVKPPQRTAHVTIDEMEAMRRQKLADHSCSWRQDGAEIMCDSSNIQHGMRIGPNMHLIGTDEDGKPIFGRRQPIYPDLTPDELPTDEQSA